jgi:hypothetical protein
MTGSSCPERCATTTGMTMATETAASGTLGAKAHRPKATTGTAVRTRSAADEGWVIAATSANASEKNGRIVRRSLASNQLRPGPPATHRLYCATLDFDIILEAELADPTVGGSGEQSDARAWPEIAAEKRRCHVRLRRSQPASLSCGGS